MDAWKLLEQRWPFEPELAEVPELKRQIRYVPRSRVCSRYSPRILRRGRVWPGRRVADRLEAGRNLDSNPEFREELQSLAGDFETYRHSRAEYFRSRSLNRRHYWATAKAVATILGEPFPNDPGKYLAMHAVQAELMPFFQPSAVLRDDQFLAAREQSKGGRLVAEVLDLLLHSRPWRAVLIRYHQTYRVFSRLYECRETGNGVDLVLDDRSIPVFNLQGRYPSDASILALTMGGEPRPRRPRATRDDNPEEQPANSAFEALKAHILGLGDDVTPLPRRANGSFVFRRMRNFVTLSPTRSSLRIDVYTGSGWADGVRVSPGIGIEAAIKRIDEAYRLAG